MHKLLGMLLISMSLMACSDEGGISSVTNGQTVAPYGTWASPISAADVYDNSNNVGTIRGGADGVYWLESRAEEGGRLAVIGFDAGGVATILTPRAFNVRTRVHEYGGAAYLIHGDMVIFSNFKDQRLYRQVAVGIPEALTPESGSDLRYADCIMDQSRDRLICVREDHRRASGAGEAVNTLVAIDLATGGEGEVLFEGTDFVAAPRLNAKGDRLVWLAWQHPNMPWDDVALYEAHFNPDGTLLESRMIADGSAGAVSQPMFAPDGALYFLADWSGWWNLYRWTGTEAINIHPEAVEMGGSNRFGVRYFAFIDDENVVLVKWQDGYARLAHLNLVTGEMHHIGPRFAHAGGIVNLDGTLWFEAGSETSPVSIYRLNPDFSVEEIYVPSHTAIASELVSIPTAITFPTGEDEVAHGFFYAPNNPDYAGPLANKPPLVVRVHGGPTGSTEAVIRADIQYWTSRGFAVLDVNYRGSTGYGRAYMERLDLEWGVVDVEDVVNGARWLAEQGFVDFDRLVIRGGSAGGFTVLEALSQHDVFDAGTSYFGISDLAALARDTHKFESRYLDQLIGPYPEAMDVYEARSAINHVDKITVPILLLQGLDDQVVPPNQSEMIYEAVKAKGIITGYLPFEGEGHGFRKAENNIRALESELAFYGRIFGFTPAGDLPELQLENED